MLAMQTFTSMLITTSSFQPAWSNRVFQGSGHLIIKQMPRISQMSPSSPCFSPDLRGSFHESCLQLNGNYQNLFAHIQQHISIYKRIDICLSNSINEI